VTKLWLYTIRLPKSLLLLMPLSISAIPIPLPLY
jgi:hypothetical protein